MCKMRMPEDKTPAHGCAGPETPAFPAAALVPAIALAVLGFAFVLRASYPGYLYEDSFQQLTQAITGELDDWHPTFITLLWSCLLRVFPGPVGFLVLDNLLIWGGLALIALGVMRRAGAWGLLVLAVPLAPGLFNFLGHIHKDTLVAAWMLAAFACAFKVNQAETGPRARLVWQVLANLLALAVFLTRSNAVFGLVPLLLYANLRFGWRRNLLATLAMLCLMPAVQTLQSRALGIEPQHHGDSLKTFHLLALSYFENRNLFPGTWIEHDARTIVEGCYSPVQWDTVSRWGHCAGLYRELRRQELWGGGEMTRAWLGALASNPLGAWSAMAATFKLSMHDPNSLTMLYPPPKSDLVNWEVAEPFRRSTQLARDYIQSEFNLQYGKPWAFAVVLACGSALLLVLRLGGTPLGALALAVQASGTIYLLSYFPINVSAEYRYFYWSGFAAYLGLLLVPLAWLARRRPEGQGTELPPLPRALSVPLRLLLCMLPALMLALVFGAGRLPTETRVVQLAPQGDGVVAVTRLGTASTPRWMERHEGEIETGGWHWQEGPLLRTVPGAGVLVARIDTLHHAIRLHFLTGPDGGSVQIQDGPFSRLVDTHADEAGEIVVDLPPHGKLADRPRHASWHEPARVLLWTLLLGGLLFRLGRKRTP